MVFFFLYPFSKGIYPTFITSSADENGQVQATFLGNTTILFSDGETNLMIDGFVTRPSFFKILTHQIKSDPKIVSEALKQIGSPKINAILVSHSHHDHSMDAPEMARQTGAIIYGSQSAAEVAYGASIPSKQIRVIKEKEFFDIGKFRVTFILSKHAPTNSIIESYTGVGKNIEQPLIQPRGLNAFKEGGSYSIYLEHPRGKILIQASAGFIPKALDQYKVDVLFIGIGNLGGQSEEYREDYFKNVADASGAQTIYPIHWDFFMKPLSEGIVPMPIPFDRFEVTRDFISGRYGKRQEKVYFFQLYQKVVLF